MKKNTKNIKQDNKSFPSFWEIVKRIGEIILIITASGTCGFYIQKTISSAEFHEREMQLYKLHQDRDLLYRQQIREMEKEIYELRKENLQLKNNKDEK